MTLPQTLLRSGRLFDFALDDYREPVDILIEGDRIREVSEREIAAPTARIIDCERRIVTPGLIDAHVHAIGVSLDPAELPHLRPYLVAARAANVLGDMLDRGFTTVRDAGGADSGLAQAVEEGTTRGPRLFVSGLALAQTGGQGDFRQPGEVQLGCPVCSGVRTLTRLVDGVDAVRAAVREELRAGADQIKVMASGGIASGIPLDHCHFSLDELATMVDEARRARTYVMAHAYETEAVSRCLHAGIRSIEHASHLTNEALELVKAKHAFIVPTVAAYDALAEEGAALGLPTSKTTLFKEMRAASLDTIERAHSLGVAIGHGSDLEGPLHGRQSREFALKSQVMPSRDVMRSATETNARLLRMERELGVIAEGAIADLLVLEDDPYPDAAVLARPESTIALVIKGGGIETNRL